MIMTIPSTACPVWFIVVFAIETRSGKPIATASELFLVRLRYWLVSGGMITLSACGSTTNRIRWLERSPSAMAASLWPQLTARMPARTISAMPATLDGDPEPFLPAGIVPFPRGFGFGRDGRLYLASGVAPSGKGDNTILAFTFEPAPRPRRLVADPELSPLDLTIAPNGHIVVASEFPFGAPDAVTTVREYDATTGRLVRVFAPDPALEFRRPRGLRFGPDDLLYCVGEDHVVAFDFSTGGFVGPVVQLPRLNGQALVLLE